MVDYGNELISVALTCLLFGVFHLGLARFNKSISFIWTVIYGFGLGLFCLALRFIYDCTQLPLSDAIIVGMSNLFLFTLLVYIYTNYANIGFYSIRIRVFEEIAESPHGLDQKQLDKLYDVPTILDVRLKRLVESGQLSFVNERYHLQRYRHILLSLVFLWLKRILGVKEHRVQLLAKR